MTPSYKSRPKSQGSLSRNSFNKLKKNVFDRHLYCFSRQANVVPPQAATAKVTVLYVAVHLNIRSVARGGTPANFG